MLVGELPLLLAVRLAEGGGGYRASSEAHEYDYREDIGEHLDELQRDGVLGDAEGNSLGEAEEQGRRGGADRVPATEDQGRQAIKPRSSCPR